MKKIWVLIGILFFAASCDQDHVELWNDEQVGMYFVVADGKEDEVHETIFGGAYTAEAGIWFTWTDKEFPNDYVAPMVYQQLVQQDDYQPRFYLGDSALMEPDTVQLVVAYSGMKQEGDFHYRLVQEAKEGSNISEISFWRDSVAALEETGNEFIFKVDQVKDTINLLVLKPSEYGYFEFDIKFDSIVPVVPGIAEYDRLAFEVSNSYALEAGIVWPTKWLGEFSEEKHAFMQTVIHLKCDAAFVAGLPMVKEYMGGNATIKKYIYDPLVKALKKYNDSHEEDKPFTFPEESSLPQ